MTLILVDVQHDFFTAEVAAGAPAFESSTRRLLRFARSRGAVIIHLRAAFRDGNDTPMPYYHLGGQRALPCIAGTPGAAPLDCAVGQGSERVLVKRTFDPFVPCGGCPLEDVLQASGIAPPARVVVAGLITSVCVLLTAAGLYQRGFRPALVPECCADAPAKHDFVLKAYAGLMFETVPLRDIAQKIFVPARVSTRRDPYARAVVVFGSSQAREGTAAWARAETVGRLLRVRGYSVINGGYMGTMEACAKGFSSVPPPAASDGPAPSVCEGVIVPALFASRSPDGNPHLTKVTKAATILDRLAVLMRRARVFLVLPGTLGTLTELVLALQLAAVEAARPVASAPGGGRPGPPRIFALRDPWEKTIGGVAAELGLPAAHVQLLTFVDTVEEFVACLDRDDPLATASRL